MAHLPITYWDYIKVEPLLALQSGLERDDDALSNDEVLFITVHQIDELWFKLILRELVMIRDCFARSPVPEQSLASAVRGIRRTSKLLQNVAQHFELMETMTTRDYLAFRDKLSPASGFQSAQMREIEILMGLEVGQRVAMGHESSYLDALRHPDGSASPALLRVQARLKDEATLKRTIGEWLHRTPIQGSGPDAPDDQQVVEGFIEEYLEAHQRQQAAQIDGAKVQALNSDDADRLRRRFEDESASARRFLTAADHPEAMRPRISRIRAAIVFIESYRELPLLAWPREVLDGIVALEQAFLIFRQRHARMVERVIGRRTGTGGSAGVDYLDQTALRYRVFGDVWAVRTVLLRRDALPPVRRAELYDFAGGR
ncbi:tryptophan 2,3-dioxygenase family protein [Paraliomyxa miuraensis]|uniref:tryptophan 2,3-dioxygenase family protein n=1 Tax=Paraliomyxa miuraensis TaxID=376150 RepID=UPI00224CD1D6|nr:tryptophan 2,3-dioxygenase family protein [Paraliomyxa miuraensis]MCX4243770.1 tryptophan 2,3-dioxygenase family protein [Paraliomyxa miuraensis]